MYLLPSHRPPSHSLCLRCVGVFVRFLLAVFLLLLIFQQVTCTQNKIKAGQRQRQVTNGEGGAGAEEGEREQAPPTREQHQRNAKGHLNMEKLKQNVARGRVGEGAGDKSRASRNEVTFSHRFWVPHMTSSGQGGKEGSEVGYRGQAM